MTRRMHANLIKALVIIVIFIVLAVKSMIGEAHGYKDVRFLQNELTGGFDDTNVLLK